MSGMICELLDLDRDVVAAHADSYRGLAYAREAAGEMNRRGRADRQEGDAIAAHYLAIAAGYLGAAAPAEAPACFKEAAQAARRQAEITGRAERDPARRAWGWRQRALVLDACQPRPMLVDELVAALPTEEALPPTAVGELVLVVMRHAAARRAESGWAHEAIARLTRLGRERSMIPVGTLQIPLAFALRLAQFLPEARRASPERPLMEWGREFATRLSERVGIAQSNRAQWRALHTRLLPIEPEALLAVQVWRESAGAMGAGRLALEFLSEMPPTMRAYAESARLIFEADAEPDRPTSAAPG